MVSSPEDSFPHRAPVELLALATHIDKLDREFTVRGESDTECDVHDQVWGRSLPDERESVYHSRLEPWRAEDVRSTAIPICGSNDQAARRKYRRIP